MGNEQRRRTRWTPDVECLERRGLLTTGVTANLSKRVLTIVGTSASDAIEVDVEAIRTRRGVQGTITVEDVASYQASSVRKIVIKGVIGEPIHIDRLGNWLPAIQVVKPASNPPRPTPTPKPTPIPIPTPTPTPSPTPAPTVGAVEQAIVDAVNQQRALNGLAPLTVNAKLMQAARIQSANMARLGVMAHELPQTDTPTLTDRAARVGYDFRSLGENIAYGYPDASSVMDAWMNSPGHRSNILGRDYTEIGVAVAYSASGQPYYTQVFGRSMG